MTHQRKPDHVPPEELDRYFGGELDEDGESRVEEHLATCSECSARAREIRALRHAMDEWTAEVHGAAFWRARLESAVDSAAGARAGAAWHERLDRWRERWLGRAEGIALVMGGQAAEELSGFLPMPFMGSSASVPEAAKRVARLVTTGLDDLLRPGAAWRFEPVPARTLRVRGAPGKPEAAGATREVAAAGTPRVIIRLTPRGGTGHVLEVRIEHLPADGQAPLVVIVPEAGEPMVREPSQDPTRSEYVAVFEDPPAGSYVVALEPPA